MAGNMGLQGRGATRYEAFRRIREMSREGLQRVRQMGVTGLTYDTDLIPGVDKVVLTALHTPPTVKIELVGAVAFPAEKQYVFDEAVLFGRDEDMPSKGFVG